MTASVTTQHEKIKAFDWEPSYFHRDALYPTKYKIPPRTKDPFVLWSASTSVWRRRRTTGSTARLRMR